MKIFSLHRTPPGSAPASQARRTESRRFNAGLSASLFRILAVACGLWASGSDQAHAALPGMPDISFGPGNDGAVQIPGTENDIRNITQFGSRYGLAVQPDGKIIMGAGFDTNSAPPKDGFQLWRLNRDGSLDRSFGEQGRTRVPFPNGIIAVISSIVVQADGGILAAGGVTIDDQMGGEMIDFALIRLLPNGTPDFSFGNAGLVTTRFLSTNDFGQIQRLAEISSLAVQQDGKIVAAGSALVTRYHAGLDDDFSDSDFALFRYNQDGSPDLSFGTGGRVVIGFPGTYRENPRSAPQSSDHVRGLVIQAGGRILAGGEVYDSTLGRYTAKIIGLLPNGALDSGFAENGIAQWPGKCTGIGLQSDDRIVAWGHAGNSFEEFGQSVVVYRFFKDGAKDPGFAGTGGFSRLNYGSLEGPPVGIQKDDRIILVSKDYEGWTAQRITVLTPEGNGEWDVRNQHELPYMDSMRVAFQSGGKILFAGKHRADSMLQIIRYEGATVPAGAVTGEAADVTARSAKLTAQVNPEGLETTVVFEIAKAGEAYAAGRELTAEGSPLKAGSGVTSGYTRQPVAAAALWLEPHTSYRFRVRATNTAGVSTGEERTFTTGNNAPQILSGPAFTGAEDTPLTGTLTSASGASIDATSPASPVRGTSGWSFDNEEVSMVIDNSADTKYTNLDKAGSGFTVRTGPRRVRRLNLVSGNDSPQRDPASWRLEGSRDGVVFSPAGQGTVSFTERLQLRSLPVNSTESWEYHRLVFPTLNSGADALQVAEVQLLTAAAELTEGAVITGTPPAGGSFDGESAQMLLYIKDGALWSKMGVFGTGNTQLVITPSAANRSMAARGVTLISGFDNERYTGRHPTSLRVEGSNNNGTSWTLIHFQPQVEAVDRNFVLQEHVFPENTTAYDRYRVTLGAPANGTFLQLSELQLHGAPVDQAPAPAVDSDGDSLVFRKTSEPAHGTVAVNADGTFTYTPAADYSGPDSFTIAASDGLTDSNTVTVNVNVTAVNDPPVLAETAPLSTIAGTPAGGTLTATDAEGAALVFSKVSNPANGAASVNTDGAFTYTPAADFHGTDSFTAKASDGVSDSNIITVTVVVTPGKPAFEQWLETRFSPAERAEPLISGPAADPDGDSLPNAVEYVLGLAPMANQPAAFAPREVVADGISRLSLDFLRHGDVPAGATLFVQESTDMGLWTTIASKSGASAWSGTAAVTETAAPDGSVTVRVVPAAGITGEPGGQSFLRLGAGVR